MIPREATHIYVENIAAVPARTFQFHKNIQVVICHDGVEKIGQDSFYSCPSLRRVIMPGVKEVERYAFSHCKGLTDIECGKLERIGEEAFYFCTSLSSIDLPSIRIVEEGAFYPCRNLIDVKFGKDLESIRRWAFEGCTSLERITLPLKDGIIADNDNIFGGCKKLNHIYLLEGVHETAAALLLEEWKNDMNEEIDAINQILPNTPPGGYRDAGEKTQAIQTWIRSVLRKYTYYKAEHRRYVDEAAAALELVLPNDVMLENILPFLELPSDTCAADDDESSDDIPLAALGLT